MRKSKSLYYDINEKNCFIYLNKSNSFIQTDKNIYYRIKNDDISEDLGNALSKLDG